MDSAARPLTGFLSIRRVPVREVADRPVQNVYQVGPERAIRDFPAYAGRVNHSGRTAHSGVPTRMAQQRLPRDAGRETV
ncbi:predicted protein [Streptomyces viridochromogenes DSM 40736]|uniref:Predicted protein n=1 Tax=Streptomyces viridochromogenes (strain DSM 40736 / JCM 4977 / BCRC 1201 / Tue 494) TaxID=591159 RepID=D9XHB4_STRVT|nr:predicted protein [Streptomyces viridochromogenes DSM 40736]